MCYVCCFIVRTGGESLPANSGMLRLKQNVFVLICEQESNKKQTPEKEDRYTGTVTWKVYIDYWKAGAGILLIILLAVVFLAGQVRKDVYPIALLC